MAGRDDRIVTQSWMDRFYGPPLPEIPAGKFGAGASEAERFRRIATSSDRNGGPSPDTRFQLSEEEFAKAELLIRRLLDTMANTRLTAALPPHNVPQYFSTPVDLNGTAVIPAAVSAAPTTLVRYTVPEGRYAVINGYGVDVTSAPAYTYNDSLLWTIRFNGQPVEYLRSWGEHRGSLLLPRRTFIVIPQGQQVSFEVRRAVASGNPDTVVASLIGWTWRLRYNVEGTRASATAY